jgi:2,5-dihydroxypyridine 5,6-dioxygenase
MSTEQTNPAELALLFRQELELCRAKPGSQIVLVTDLTTRLDYVQAAFAAADSIGAKIFELKIAAPFNPNMIASQGGGDTISALPGAIQAIHSADLVLVFHVALGSQWMQDARKRGTRFLLIIDGPDELKRLMSPPGLKEAILYAHGLCKRSKELRVTSAAGTDFVAKLGELETNYQYGYADEPGRVDTWGGAHFSTWANPGSCEGTIVLKPGDAWILPYVRYFEGEVRLTIEKGHIRKIDGLGSDARLMRQFMKEHQASKDDLRPYAVSHLGWGLNPNSYLDQIALHGHSINRIASHTRAWPGVFLFSTGPDDQGGGKNTTPAHLDLPMSDCTVAFDDRTVIKEGVIVDEKMLVKPKDASRLAA